MAACGDEEDSETVAGNGYEFTLPEGWRDESDKASGIAEEVESESPAGPIGTDFDAFAAAPPAEGFTANVNVIREGSLSLDLSARRYANATIRVLDSPRLRERYLPPSFVVTSGAAEPAPTELDGASAIQFEYAAESSGRRLRFLVVAALRDGVGFTLTFTALADRFAEDASTFDEILNAWRWR